MQKKLFAIYSPKTECVKVSLNANTTVHLDKPSNTTYLPRLAREEPEIYAKLFSRDGDLQEYVETMKSLIKCPSIAYIIVTYN